MTDETGRITTSGAKMVVMTTPSLDPKVNVSGISSVVRGLMFASRQPEIPFDWQIVPASAGKRDRQTRGIGWLMSQISVMLNFYQGIRHNDPAIVHVNGPLSDLAIVRDAVLVRVARMCSKHVVYHLHGGTYVHRPPENQILRRIIVGSLKKPEIILVLGDLEAASVEKLYDVAPETIRVLRNAVEVPKTCPAKSTEGALRVLSIGRLSPEKGLSVLCDAIEAGAALKQNLELRMYGAGDLETEITSRLGASLGDAFRFEGIAGDDEKAHAYAWADVVVMPSLWGEGLPMVLLEAMAAGVVPVATPDGSIAEVLKDGENGILVQTGSPESLAKGLHRALELKRKGGLHHLAQNAHWLMQEAHSLSVQGRILGQIYAEIMQ